MDFKDIIKKMPYYNKLKKLYDKYHKKLRKKRAKYTNLLEAYRKRDTEFMEFYELYTEKVDVNVDIDLDKLIETSNLKILNKYSKDLSYTITHTKIFPSKVDFQYAGIDDIRKYFLKLMIISIGVWILGFLNNAIDGDIIGGITNGLFLGVVLFILGVYFPKIKLLLFRGEIKIQIMIVILNMISSLNSGLSLQETIKNISNNPEYGIPSFEFKNIIYDINRGGYSFKEALERAKMRTKIDLMKKLYDQLIISANKGEAQLLLKNLYNEIIRESMSKIDSSKFQISNLGNLVFGVGMILPFSGMLLSSIQGGMSFDGITNTINLLLTKIAPMATLIFSVFIKMKIE